MADGGEKGQNNNKMVEEKTHLGSTSGIIVKPRSNRDTCNTQGIISNPRLERNTCN
jgi:hypothetical protein